MGLIDKFREKLKGKRKTREVIPSREVDDLLQGTRQSIYRLPGRTEPEYHLSKEQREKLISDLEKQYQRSLKVLRKYDFLFQGGYPTERVPSWEQVKQGLTPAVLDKVSRLQEPVLLLIPNTVRVFRYKAILNSWHHVLPSSINIPDSGNIDLWNGGRTQSADNWRIGIVEGQAEIEADPKISGDNFEMAQSWMFKYLGEGLDVINDLDTFMMLVMHAQATKKPLNTKTLTVLNAKNLKQGDRLAYGTLDNGQVYLGTAHSNIFFKNIRLRPIVWVKSQQNV